MFQYSEFRIYHMISARIFFYVFCDIFTYIDEIFMCKHFIHLKFIDICANTVLIIFLKFGKWRIRVSVDSPLSNGHNSMKLRPGHKV